MPNRRRRALPILLAGSLCLILAGCSLIPPQRLADPLGLNGATVPLAPIGGPELGPLQARPCSAFADRATHCAAAEFGGEMEDVDTAGFGGIVRRFDVRVGTREALDLAMFLPTEAPPRVTVSSVAIDVHVRDTETGRVMHPDAPFEAEVADPVTFERGDCTAVSCRYVADDASALDVSIHVNGRDLDELLAILTGGGANELSGTLAYGFDAPGVPPGDYGVQVTLDAPEGWVRF